MCVLYAFLLWWRNGKKGKVIVQFLPTFHVMVAKDGKVLHGTNKYGKWQVEELDTRSLARWFACAK